GMGYSTRSLWQLSRKLSSADVPTLLILAASERHIAVGAQFGLASQCAPAIDAVRDSAVQHKMMSLDADDTLQLISEFEGCSPEARRRASDAREDLQHLMQERQALQEQETKQKAENDGRIQANGLKLLDPEQAKTLSHEERLEIYQRSLAAMGLKEDGPMTPDQKKLVDRMYRSMVLGEAKTPPNQ
ncbi:MAG TPA: hypothetical protein VGU90_00400, partial [Terriglobales bacterium]|nr:hypothetical protein [Terriglobales bacterium]